MKWAKVALLTSLSLVGGDALAQTAPLNTATPSVIGGGGAVSPGGNIRVPPNYREVYQFLGSWSVSAGQGQGAQQIHNVYASPGAIAGYRGGGRFPDGTVLVKEVFAATTSSMTTGTVSHADTLKGWFVMVADSHNSHGASKLWGDGWGWSWFDADKPTMTTSTDYKVDCQGCHIPARATNWIYVRGYPPLRR
jgi:hypothetical protein